MKKLALSIIFLLISIIMTLPALAANEILLNDVIVDEAGRLIMIEAGNNGFVPKPEISRIINPDRLVIDLPNSILKTKNKVIDVNNDTIKQVRIAQYDNTENKSVRIVVESKDKSPIEKIKVSAGQGTTMIQLAVLPSSSRSSILEDNNFVKITNIDYRDNQLIINGIGSIKIKEPFILKDPTRLVVDIPNSKLSSKKLLSPIIVNDDNVGVVRIGQFDETTVRLVIESNNPNHLYPIYGADQQTLYISSNPSFSNSNLPKGMKVGQIKQIKVVGRTDNGTIIRIESSSPIAHRLRRIHEPEKVVLDLINAQPPSENTTRNIQMTKELTGIKVGQLMAGNPNSRIVLDLSNSGIEVKSNVSIDGKTMEIVLKQGEKIVPISTEGRNIGVVLDAGHGGYDSGCQADGYREKDIALDITKRVKLLLERAGIKVYMTRLDDSTLSLKERVDYTNNLSPLVFVSIHVNASTSSVPEGIDTHWYTNQSIPLAKSIQNALMKKVNAVDRGIVKNMFYVIHHTPVPAVLVETGFLTNPKERVNLLTHNRKQNTANGIAEGVLQFLGTKYSASQAGLQR